MVLLLVVAGCGGSEENEAEPSAELEGALAEVDDAARQDTESPNRRDGAETAEEALRNYFALLNRREYSKAWRMVNEPVQDQFGGFDTWVAGYVTTESSRIVSVERTDRSKASEILRLEIRAVDSGPCDEALVRGFAGPWTLERQSDGWLITAAAFEQVSGEASASCGGSAPVYFTDAAYQLAQEPSAIQIDNHDVLTGLSWSNWGGPTASATGTLQHRVCDPNCASGYDVQLSAEATMSGIVSCGGSQQYSSLSIAFTGSSPDGIVGPATVANYGAC